MSSSSSWAINCSVLAGRVAQGAPNAKRVRLTFAPFLQTGWPRNGLGWKFVELENFFKGLISLQFYLREIVTYFTTDFPLYYRSFPSTSPKQTPNYLLIFGQYLPHFGDEFDLLRFVKCFGYLYLSGIYSLFVRRAELSRGNPFHPSSPSLQYIICERNYTYLTLLAGWRENKHSRFATWWVPFHRTQQNEEGRGWRCLSWIRVAAHNSFSCAYKIYYDTFEILDTFSYFGYPCCLVEKKGRFGDTSWAGMIIPFDDDMAWRSGLLLGAIISYY